MTVPAAPGSAGAAARPFRRRVFYIPGYDPFPARRYRELYRREAAAQAAVSGYRIEVAGRPGSDGYGWDARAGMPDEAGGATPALAEARIEVLAWSGIVRASMRQGIAATYVQLARTAWVYLASGALLRLMRLRRGPILAALYPVAMLLAQALAAAGAGAGVGLAAAALVPGGAGVALLAGAAAGLLAAGLVLVLFHRLDGRIYAYYLMQDYAFTAGEGGAYPAALDRRIGEFAERIGAAIDEGGAAAPDEVLVVGHSSGAHLAVSALARLLRDRPAADGGPALALLTLGQVVPMLSFLPQAGGLRADLAWLSRQDRLFWLDVTAPGDGCAFALCDPVAVSGAGGAGQRWPLVISAAFSQTLAPERFRRLRRRYFRLHFQYLCAFDRPGDYDYFRITAGPRSLAQRFAGRLPSPSRITTPLSGYRVAAEGAGAGAAPQPAAAP